MKEVTIIVTSKQTGKYYLSRSFPDDDKDNDGIIEFYKTPVYEIHLASDTTTKVWPAVRFMPYWNDPKTPSGKYRTKGFVNSGLHKLHRKAVGLYLPSYGTQNRYSPYSGAIQMRDNFLIHAGPRDLSEIGWGSAGCVEIIGDFDSFKADIRDLSGINSTVDTGQAITKLVQNRKLFIEVEYETPPDFKKNLVVP